MLATSVARQLGSGLRAHPSQWEPGSNRCPWPWRRRRFEVCNQNGGLVERLALPEKEDPPAANGNGLVLRVLPFSVVQYQLDWTDVFNESLLTASFSVWGYGLARGLAFES